uniref:Uncharacterized protein n=1 Tax=Anguilla anguilla TaxID=7936 RepID=A0A0E9RA25_ANGAN
MFLPDCFIELIILLVSFIYVEFIFGIVLLCLPVTYI